MQPPPLAPRSAEVNACTAPGNRQAAGNAFTNCSGTDNATYARRLQTNYGSRNHDYWYQRKGSAPAGHLADLLVEDPGGARRQRRGAIVNALSAMS